MQKNKYLSYFKQTTASDNSSSNLQQNIGSSHVQGSICGALEQRQKLDWRPQTSQYMIKNSKRNLPHIIEDYQFKITNRLLAQKIQHPRRDKIILGSFHSNQEKNIFKRPTSYTNQTPNTQTHTHFQRKFKNKQINFTEISDGCEEYNQNQRNHQSCHTNQKNYQRCHTNQRKPVIFQRAFTNKENNQLDNQLTQKVQIDEENEGWRRPKSKKSVQKSSKRFYKSKPDRQFRTFDNINSSCNNHMNNYILQLQNERMGRRIMNTRSTVQDMLNKTYYHASGMKLNRDKFVRGNMDSMNFRQSNKQFSKINNGIKSFFNHSQNKFPIHSHSQYVGQDETKQHGSLDKYSISRDWPRNTNANDKARHKTRDGEASHHGFELSNPIILEPIGKGALTLTISQLSLLCNPNIHPTTMLSLELIPDEVTFKEIANSEYLSKKNSQNLYYRKRSTILLTPPFPYQYISTTQQPGIQFKIPPLQKAYLRIFKNQGIQSRQIGFVTLNLNEQIGVRQTKETYSKRYFIKQMQVINGKKCYRKVLVQAMQSKLQKINQPKTSSRVTIQFNVHGGYFLASGEEDMKDQVTNTKGLGDQYQ